ncbi:MAG: DNA ligase D [Pseudomonadota bacterium]|nr:DNA ligase D [Pseudomonadota bacterium]
MAKSRDALRRYREMRDFSATPEPKGDVQSRRGELYVVQKHDARRLHFDFRLELDGVLKSWAVTRGPSMNPADKRLAVRTEDHPVTYGSFEGVIPKGYGAGTVIVWDRGSWIPKGDPHDGLKKGKLVFDLAGERLKGGFALIRMKKKRGEKRENWLLVKERDELSDANIDPAQKWKTSVKSGLDLSGTRRAAAGIRRNKRSPKRKGAKRKPPAFTPPQLATLRDAPPEGDEWVHEIKYDGYRIQALIADGRARLATRTGRDWTRRFPSIAEALGALPIEDAAIDGELVAIDDNGHSDFSALQQVEENGGATLIYYAFDLLELDGEDMRKRPLIERKAALKRIIEPAVDPLRFSDHIEGGGEAVIAMACAMRMEGVISKKAAAPYRSGRGSSWIKSKCSGRDEFIVVGYRKSEKRGRAFASLLLGEYEDGELRYRGRVGTGFDESAFSSLKTRMRGLTRKTSPIASTPAEARRNAVWLEPSLVVEIAYSERTPEGRLRHPSYQGLREDKPPEQVTMTTDTTPQRIAGVTLTHPDKILYEEQGVTKRALADYFFLHADRILPYLKGRPISLVRCPDGSGGECFFQKHHNRSAPKEIDSVVIQSKTGKDEPYLVINDEKGLVAAAQIGALELHLWGARSDNVERPERIILDLDPDEGVGFSEVRRAAFDVRDTLAALGLQSYPLLTGGKGVHVIAPISRRRSWGDIKEFCRGVARSLEAAAPAKYVAAAAKAKRKNRIFIDWLRNERGATAVAPYSTRARKGAPIATPVSWEELKKTDSAARYTLKNIENRLASLQGDPWADYFRLRQSVTNAMLAAVEKS